MFKKIVKQDYDVVAKLMMRAFRNSPWNEDWDFKRAYQRVEQLNDGNYARCYAYFLDDKIVGVVCGRLLTYVDDLELRIEDFYVDPDYQRMGIGKKMMTLLIEELCDVDIFSLVTGKDFYSVDFYQKNSFEKNEDVTYMCRRRGLKDAKSV